MSVTLRVTPEQLRAQAARINNILTRIDARYSNIGELSLQFPTYWEGEAYSLHRERMRDFLGNAGEIMAELFDRPVRLMTMAGLYSETEKQNEELGASLDSDIIT